MAFVICVTGILVTLAVWYSRSTEEVDDDVQTAEVKLSLVSSPASPEDDAKQKRAALLASQLEKLGFSLSNSHSVSVNVSKK